jgi:predicted nucleic acid-binding protein
VTKMKKIPKVVSFDDFLPPTLYWDASFVINFAYPAARYHRPARAYLDRLNAAHTISYLSTLTFDEVYFILLEARIAEDHPGRKFWRIYNADHAAIVPYLDELQALAEELYTHPQVRVVAADPALVTDAVENMRCYHLLPRDAFHLAIMRHHDIINLATMDADFLAVPDLILHTCVPTLLDLP